MILNFKKQQLEQAYQSYFAKKQGDSSYFNFDLLPLINNFSFTEFLKTDSKREHSAVLVITDNQYILGYTDAFGIGTHKAAMARIIKDLTGGGYIRDTKEARSLENNCIKQFITARIVYDYKGDNQFGTPIYSGAVYFTLPQDKTISIDQFEIFKKFYQDYYQELEMLIRKFGMDKFSIQYEYIDEEGTKIIKQTNSLQDVYAYYERCVDENKPHQIENEIIFGITTKHKTK